MMRAHLSQHAREHARSTTLALARVSSSHAFTRSLDVASCLRALRARDEREARRSERRETRAIVRVLARVYFRRDTR